jgi:hypothetical protein
MKKTMKIEKYEIGLYENGRFIAFYDITSLSLSSVVKQPFSSHSLP